MVIVLTGAAGAGATTLGRALAAALHWPFLDADTSHPAAVIARAIDRRESLILAAPARTRKDRELLRDDLRHVRFVCPGTEPPGPDEPAAIILPNAASLDQTVAFIRRELGL